MSTELIIAAIKNTGRKNAVFVPVYILFSIVWGSASFCFVQGRDSDDPQGDSYDAFFRTPLL
jgi:hypothetical protein